MSVFEKIEAQQKGKENSPAWMVGEQLKDICRREPGSAELVEQDLEAVTLDAVAGKIKAWADEAHKTQKGNCVCVPPNVAEEIIRKAYGLQEAPSEPQAQKPAEPAAPVGGLEFLDLSSFL